MSDSMNETIAAIATPFGSGGIGIVRISGDRALEIGGRVFVSAKGKQVSDFATHTVHYGKAVGVGGETIDEVLLTYMKAPHSYTGEDVVEISCHGGVTSVKNILKAVTGQGARLAGRGEFTKRAFLNGKLDLAKAEAVIDIINSKTDRALGVAVNQLEGSLSRKIDEIREKLVTVMAYVEAETDFPEDDVSGLSTDEVMEKLLLAKSELEKLLKTADTGKLVRDGITTAIVGRPNVGKSSLLNALSGRERAIVTDIPGTTRDVIEEYVTIGGAVLRLLDTAGIRETGDAVEKIGVDRALDSAKKAELVLFVADLSSSPSAEDKAIISSLKEQKVIVVLNKTDKEIKGAGEEYSALSSFPTVRISAAKEEGIDILAAEIEKLFNLGMLDHSTDALLTNLRHVESITRASESVNKAIEALRQGIPPDMLYVDLFDALSALGEVVGMSVSEEVVDKIFEKFCVGK